MARLTAKKRNQLPAGSFALKGRRYPVNDKAHARNALARVAQHGTPEEKAAVRRKVQGKFPGIAVSGPKKTSAKKTRGRKPLAAKR
jgi:hypothetical protein